MMDRLSQKSSEKDKNDGWKRILIIRCNHHILTMDTSPFSEHLQTWIGKTVLIKLRGGKSIRGKLLDFDQYMNLVIQDSIELMNKNDQGSANGDNRFGTVLLRADNILIIAIEPSI
jgi:small nuclear ribonucleoprotein